MTDFGDIDSKYYFSTMPFTNDNHFEPLAKVAWLFVTGNTQVSYFTFSSSILFIILMFLE